MLLAEARCCSIFAEMKLVFSYNKQTPLKSFWLQSRCKQDLFYEQADSLVGICRDVATDSSRTLTLDLEQFDAWIEMGSQQREAGKEK